MATAGDVNRDKIEKSIKEITETGEWVLDQQKLKHIKSFCKKANVNVDITFECIMSQLKKKHAQIRYSSLQLIEQLFDRSKHFRELLTEDFPVFTQLAVGIQDKKLPPPEQVAVKLKEYAIALIQSWLTKYGERYRQIDIAYEFLLNNGILARENGSLASIHASDRNKSNTEARRRVNQLNRFELLKADVDNHLEIIRDNLINMEGCFEILVPKNDFITNDGSTIDFDALLKGEADTGDSSTNHTYSDTYKDSILSHGLGSNRYKITIDMSEDSLLEDIKETDENRIIFDELREAYSLLETKHMNQLDNWMNTLIRMDVMPNKVEKEKIVKELVNLKAQATEDIEKAKLLGIKLIPREERKRIDTTGIGNELLDDDDDEFEDELFEEIDLKQAKSITNDTQHTLSSSKLPPLQRIFPLAFEPNMIEDVTYSGPPIMTENDRRPENTENKERQKQDIEREELLKRAPVVEWGDDLYYWDKKNAQFNTSGIERNHRFMGVGEGTNEIPDHLLDQLRKRPIYYKTEEPKELQACRHPLHNGGLCPRKDLVTCPFHGPIIPRDELGRPIGREDESPQTYDDSPNDNIEAETTYKPHSKKPDPEVMNNLWELLESDVTNQSGKITKRRRGRKLEKKPTKKSALVNVNKKPSTSFSRLERHINSSKSRKKTEEAMEYEREMKSRNKEANNWH
ncbi:MAG: hypothetical protein EXX96DRAFT_585109 [Benjaminiella poitrasii]|nr:MAG: hypothetical protein EXX96DRAFT_585109 [Benjaminiella poitrasii]